jgi:hypothetical protein
MPPENRGGGSLICCFMSLCAGHSGNGAISTGRATIAHYDPRKSLDFALAPAGPGLCGNSHKSSAPKTKVGSVFRPQSRLRRSPSELVTTGATEQLSIMRANVRFEQSSSGKSDVGSHCGLNIARAAVQFRQCNSVSAVPAVRLRRPELRHRFQKCTAHHPTEDLLL